MTLLQSAIHISQDKNKTTMSIAKFIAYILGISLVLVFLGTCTSIFEDTGKTVVKEFAPSALLKKYEYFKQLSAGVDKKRADIEMYQQEIKELSKDSDGSKDDKFYLQQRKSELIGIISIHNQLCAEYNTAMAEFNYRFTNVGDLPATNLTPLPREIKPYINSIK